MHSAESRHFAQHGFTVRGYWNRAYRASDYIDHNLVNSPP